MSGKVPGLVLVSHSRALAEAVRTLVQQMTGDRVPIAIAAGAGEDGALLGTDATAIAAAIETAAAGPAGALVLMDLGSAVLSAGLALDLIDPGLRARVRLSPGPLVEGAVAAGARAAAGATLDEIAAEAAAGLAGKLTELGEPPGIPMPDTATPGTAPPVIEPPGIGAAVRGGTPPEATPHATPPTAAAAHAGPLALAPPTAPPRADAAGQTAIADPHGLHARPAASLVMLAGGFSAHIRIANATTGAGPVSADSVVALSSLGVHGGHLVRVEASGPDAKQAVAAVIGLLRRKAAAPPPLRAVETPAETGVGLPTVAGFAIGPIFRLQRRCALSAPAMTDADPATEAARLERAVAAAAGTMQATRDGAGIFEAHLALLRDPALLGRARTLIAAEGLDAATAWRRAVEAAAAIYAGLDDPYQRARATDVHDVGDAVLAALVGRTAAVLPDREPCVLVANDLAPSEAVRLDPAIVLGVIDRAGAATSHAAILLRAAGIPAVSGAASLVPAEGGTVAALDGGTGEVWIDPAPAIEQAIRQREAAWRAARPPPFAGGPAVTRDGQRVALLANVSGPADSRAARTAGADGIGLMRTEMLFLDRAAAPDEAEQAALVAATLAPFRGLPVVVRTLDSGGDKPLPTLPMPAEANPYLGIRGIRLCLARPELLRTQLRALLLAGCGHDLHVMFPMVATLDEVQRARVLLEVAHDGLSAEGRPHAWPVKVGAMIEVPAAALTACVLARVCDFFSIGTNDLTQYTLAAERGNPGLQDLADPAHPAVLRLVQAVVAAGRPVAVCGEAAADPEVAALLLALGVSDLSMGPASLGSIRAALAMLSVERAREAVPAALAAASASEARAAIRAAWDT